MRGIQGKLICRPIKKQALNWSLKDYLFKGNHQQSKKILLHIKTHQFQEM